MTATARTFAPHLTGDGLPMRSAIRALVVVGLSAGLGAYLGVPHAIADRSEAVAVGSAVLSTAATMLGFMLTGLAVLASITHTHLVRAMRQMGHYSDLLGSLLLGCATFFACGILGALLVFGVAASQWFMVGLLAAHVGAAALLIEVVHRFWLVLRNLPGSAQREP
jgi:hypothetical protein